MKGLGCVKEKQMPRIFPLCVFFFPHSSRYVNVSRWFHGLASVIVMRSDRSPAVRIKETVKKGNT